MPAPEIKDILYPVSLTRKAKKIKFGGSVGNKNHSNLYIIH